MHHSPWSDMVSSCFLWLSEWDVPYSEKRRNLAVLPVLSLPTPSLWLTAIGLGPGDRWACCTKRQVYITTLVSCLLEVCCCLTLILASSQALQWHWLWNRFDRETARMWASSVPKQFANRAPSVLEMRLCFWYLRFFLFLHTLVVSWGVSCQKLTTVRYYQFVMLFFSLKSLTQVSSIKIAIKPLTYTLNNK